MVKVSHGVARMSDFEFKDEYGCEFPRQKDNQDESVNISKRDSATMNMKQWEYAVARILDDYNDGKISKDSMVFNLKSLNRIKIK